MDIILFILLLLALIGNTTYHIAEKSINKEVNPMLVLSIIYFISFILSLIIMLIFYPHLNIINNLTKVNWAVILLSISSIGFELSILLAYRFGGQMSKLFNIISPGISVSLVLIGVFLYKEHMNLYNIIGLIFSILGVYLVSSSEETLKG